MSHMLPRGPAEYLQHSAEPAQATVGGAMAQAIRDF